MQIVFWLAGLAMFSHLTTRFLGGTHDIRLGARKVIGLLDE